MKANETPANSHRYIDSRVTIIFLSLCVLLVGALSYFVWQQNSTINGAINSPSTNATERINLETLGTADVVTVKPNTSLQFYLSDSDVSISSNSNPTIAKALSAPGEILTLKNGVTNIEISAHFICNQKLTCPALGTSRSITLLVDGIIINHSLHSLSNQTIGVNVGQTISYSFFSNLFQLQNVKYDKTFLEPVSPNGLPNILEAIKKGTTQIVITTESQGISGSSATQTYNYTIVIN